MGWMAKTPKRQLNGIADEEESVKTPLKKQELSAKAVLMHTSDSEDVDESEKLYSVNSSRSISKK